MQMKRPEWMRDWMRVFWERRRSRRQWVSGLTAVYWSGGVGHPWPVCEISHSGAAIETPDDWYGGTLVHLVLEHRSGDGPKSDSVATCSVWARVVRRGFQGVCVEFMPRDEAEGVGLRRFIVQLGRAPALDEKAVEEAEEVE
jgi:hypothetical protein